MEFKLPEIFEVVQSDTSPSVDIEIDAFKSGAVQQLVQDFNNKIQELESKINVLQLSLHIADEWSTKVANVFREEKDENLPIDLEEVLCAIEHTYDKLQEATIKRNNWIPFDVNNLPRGPALYKFRSGTVQFLKKIPAAWTKMDGSRSAPTHWMQFEP